MLPMTWIARTVPFTFGFHATSVPLAMLNAATWFRVTSCEPAGAPGGRTAVNCPPMYTRFLMTTITFTRPFVCHVGVGTVATTANAGEPIASPHTPDSSGHCSRTQYPSPHQPPRWSNPIPQSRVPPEHVKSRRTRIPRPMDGGRGPASHTETMEPAVFEYPRCPLRDASQGGQRRSSRRSARWPALAWPAARRAERVEVSEDGIAARSLAGHDSIAWSDVAAIRRARTTWGRMTVHVIARTGSQIEIAETIPGFDELAAMLRQPWLRLAA